MSEDVCTHIRSCDRCTRFKQLHDKSTNGSNPNNISLGIDHLDFLTIGQGTKTVNILVVTDHFTTYAQAYVTPKQTAVATAKDIMGKLS